MAKLKFEPIKKNIIDQIEVEKIVNVFSLRHFRGYSQFELSFLMGQRNLYVRDIENLEHTLTYSIPFNNYIAKIFDCGFGSIIPLYKNGEPENKIRILKAIGDDTESMFRVEQLGPEGHWTELATIAEEPKDILLPSTSTLKQKEIDEWVIKKFKNRYFVKPKTALETLKACEKDLDGSVRPLFLSRSLKAFTSRKKTPRLVSKKNDCARDVFGMEE